MLSRTDLHKISRTRLKEAKVLLRSRLYDGAKYILGYSLETAFKARICKILDSDYPDRGDLSKTFFTHKFDTLVILSGLEKLIDAQKYKDPYFAVNWSLLTDPTSASVWKETLRYEKIGTATLAEVKALILALEDKDHGVLTWIMRKW